MPRRRRLRAAERRRRHRPAAERPVAAEGPPGGRQVTYGVFESEEETFQAQARWRLVHLLPDDEPQLARDDATNVVVAGTRCSEWFERWQKAKSERRSVVRVGRGRGGSGVDRGQGPGTVGQLVGVRGSVIACLRPSPEPP